MQEANGPCCSSIGMQLRSSQKVAALHTYIAFWSGSPLHCLVQQYVSWHTIFPALFGPHFFGYK